MTKHPLIVTGILSLPLALFSFFWLNDHTHSHKFVSEPPYTIAFANFGPLNGEIFIADEDGSNAKPLVPGPANESNASFSADGKWVAFTSNRNGPYDIYMVHPDGSGLEQLTHDDAFDDQASFSPDGKKIAFVSSKNGQADIYILDLATRTTVDITNHAGGDFRPSWSPDGKWIAFSSDRDSKNPRPIFGIWHSTEIFTMRSNGTEVVKRTFIDAVAGSPCWSPDGKQLLFYQATLYQVRKMNFVERTPSTTQLSTVTLADNTQHDITKDTGEKIYPRWFPDGRISYVTWQEDGAIKFLNSDKSVKGVFNHPSWSADGKKIVYDREVGNAWPPCEKAYSNDKQFQLVRSGVFPSVAPSGLNLICNDKTAGIMHNQIMQMNIDGTHRFILFGDSAKSALAPVYSPKGDKIAFGFGRFFQSIKGPAIGDIAIINSDGSHLEVLTDGSGNYGFPSWSPDGKKLVYRGATDSTLGLFVIDLDTKQITRITHDRDNFPGWSPNGDLIAFTSKKNNNYDLFTIKPDGTSLKRITTDPGNDAHSVWSPDGQWLAFSSGKTGFKDESALHPQNPQPYGEISVIRADGTDLRVLTDNTYEEATPAWMPIKK
jgi:TolB protein